MSIDKVSRHGRPGTAIGAKGQRRVEDILDAATKILTDEGYANFSLRKVADAADIKLGNLQYYFPAKEDLLDAMLKRLFDDYAASLAKLAQSKRGNAKNHLLMMVDYLLKDQETQESCSIFWELWALSAREESVAAIMNGYYDVYLEQIANTLLEVAPKLSKRRAHRHAAVIVSMIEGASLLRGFGKPRRGLLGGFEKTIREVCIYLADDIE